jgi:hypothetical protein
MRAVLLAVLFLATPAHAITFTLTWTDGSGGAAVTLIERSSAGGKYEQITQVAPGVTTYLDGPSLRYNRTYCYRAKARMGTQVSGYSNVACASKAR